MYDPNFPSDAFYDTHEDDARWPDSGPRSIQRKIAECSKNHFLRSSSFHTDVHTGAGTFFCDPRWYTVSQWYDSAHHIVSISSGDVAIPSSMILKPSLIDPYSSRSRISCTIKTNVHVKTIWNASLTKLLMSAYILIIKQNSYISLCLTLKINSYIPLSSSSSSSV